MKTKLLLALSVLFLSGCAPYKKAHYYSCGLEDIESNSYKLIIISAAGCGWCDIALRELQEVASCKNLDVFVFDFISKNDSIRDEKYSKYKTEYTIINKTKCDGLDAVKVFPQFLLFDSNNKRIFYSKGWNKTIVQKIKTLTSCSFIKEYNAEESQ
jgi:thioredoxin-related protein